jgi:hypothetical protein
MSTLNEPLSAFPPSLPTATAAQPEPAAPASALAALAECGRAVTALAALLDLDATRLAAEALERLELTTSLPTERVLAWAPADLLANLRSLGGDAALTLALTGADGTQSAMRITLHGDDEATARLDAFQRALQPIAAAQGKTVAVAARLAVEKRHALITAQSFLATWGRADEEASALAVFYSTSAWARFLTPGNLPLWERRGLLAPNQRTCVVLCDARGDLAGTALEIVGAASTEPPLWLGVSRGAWRQFRERGGEYASLRAEEGHC